MYNWWKCVILDIYKSNRPRRAKVTQMFNALTATATVLVVFLTVEFITGLVQLWNQSAVTTAPAPAAVEPDAWEGEAPALETAPAAPTFEFTYQLCLPAAVETDNSIYDVIYDASHDLSEYIASYATATLKSQTIRQLKALAKERGLKKYSYLTKAELIEALM